MSHQIQTVIYHPEVSRKSLLSILDSQMTPFWGHVTPDPYHELPSRGVPKRGPQISSRFWGSPFWDPFCPDPLAICLKTWSPVQNPLFGPCHLITSVCFTIWRGSHFNLFYLGSLFGHLRMVKHTEEIVLHAPKSGPNPKGALRTEGRT